MTSGDLVTSIPVLTIGLPVFNGERGLAASLDRLLAQTFTDFTLVISDNGSTDRTAEICAEYMERDGRIRYFRHEKTIPWNENFRFALMQAKSPYFMWATHDDVWFPRFAEANIAKLEANRTAVCSVSKIMYVTAEGHRIEAADTGALTGSPAERLKRFFLVIGNCGRFYGVYRTEALKASFPPDMHIYALDWLVVALTLIDGDHLEVDELLLERGAQPKDYYLQRLGRIDGFEPQRLDRIVPLHCFNAALRSRVPGTVWTEIRLALGYLNMRQIVAMLEYRMPWLSVISHPFRNLVAHLFHRRWRREVG